MILVTGATGNVGGALTRQLSQAGFPVRGLTRDASRAHRAGGVEIAEGDLNDVTSLPAALDGVEGLFLFPTGNESAIINAARKAGVRRVVLLSTMAAQTRPGSTIGHSHLQAEHAIADSDLHWTFLRPGGFASNCLAWASMVRTGTVLTPFPDVSIPLIDPADVASVGFTALTQAGHHKHVYKLSGPEMVSPAQQVEAIAAVLGSRIDTAPLTSQQARRRMLRHMSADIVDTTLKLLGSPTQDELVVYPTVEDVTGAPARKFVQWVQDNVDSFR